MSPVKLAPLRDVGALELVEAAETEVVPGVSVFPTPGHNPAHAPRTRRALLAELADSGETVAAGHFPGSGLGTVERAGEGFAWRPRTI